MRFLPITYVKEGSILGKHIYDEEGRILLKKGVSVSNKLKSRIKELGINSVYIDDDYSDVELEDVIRPEIRNKAISSVRQAFDHFEKFNNHLSNNLIPNKNMEKRLTSERDAGINFLNKVSEEIIDEILSNKNIIVNLVDIKSQDTYTLQHCINVAVLSLVLGVALKLNKQELRDLCLGALLHDIGKTLVPKDILIKPAKLSEEEYKIIKEHSYKGYDYLRVSSDITGPARIISAQHHERVDGKGYPKGLSGDDIYKLTKIVSIADVYDALTSDRPYRPAMPPNEALEYIMANGDSQFDYEMVKLFVTKIVPYPVGTLVKLSNDKIAVVKEVTPKFPLRPKVQVINDDSNLDIDLMVETNIVVKEIQYEDPRK